MKSNISVAAKMFGMALFTCFVSFFVYISLFIVMRSVATDVTGYTVYEINNGQKTVIDIVETVPQIKEANQTYSQNRTPMSKSASIALGVLQTVCGLGIFFSTAGSVIASTAAKDHNNTDFNGAPEDKLKGLKIGTLAAIPLLIYNILIIVLKFLPASKLSEWAFWLYRWFILSPVKPIADLLTNNSTTLAETSVGSIFTLLIFVPLIVLFGFVMYLICYNEDSVIAKVLYKSTRKKQEPKKLGGR